jgi:hypothetical protein
MYLFNDMLEARQKRAFGLGDLSDGSIIVRTVARISFGSGWETGTSFSSQGTSPSFLAREGG